MPRERRVREIAGILRGVEGLKDERSRGVRMLEPGYNSIGVSQIGPRLESPKTASLHQVVAEPPEAEAGLIISEAGSGTEPHVSVCLTRGFSVSELQTKIGHPPQYERRQI